MATPRSTQQINTPTLKHALGHVFQSYFSQAELQNIYRWPSKIFSILEPLLPFKAHKVFISPVALQRLYKHPYGVELAKALKSYLLPISRGEYSFEHALNLLISCRENNSTPTLMALEKEIEDEKNDETPISGSNLNDMSNAASSIATATAATAAAAAQKTQTIEMSNASESTPSNIPAPLAGAVAALVNSEKSAAPVPNNQKNHPVKDDIDDAFQIFKLENKISMPVTPVKDSSKNYSYKMFERKKSEIILSELGDMDDIFTSLKREGKFYGCVEHMVLKQLFINLKSLKQQHPDHYYQEAKVVLTELLFSSEENDFFTDSSHECLYAVALELLEHELEYKEYDHANQLLEKIYNLTDEEDEALTLGEYNELVRQFHKISPEECNVDLKSLDSSRFNFPIGSPAGNFISEMRGILRNENEKQPAKRSRWFCNGERL